MNIFIKLLSIPIYRLFGYLCSIIINIYLAFTFKNTILDIITYKNLIQILSTIHFDLIIIIMKIIKLGKCIIFLHVLDSEFILYELKLDMIKNIDLHRIIWLLIIFLSIKLLVSDSYQYFTISYRTKYKIFRIF